MYEHGWKRNIRYIIAFSNNDVQDVTWRYSNQHKAVLTRRTICTEDELRQTILRLRSKRQQDASPALLKMLAKRTVCELAEFLIEKDVTDNERRGRSSGSLEWRKQRMEIGVNNVIFYCLKIRMTFSILLCLLQFYVFEASQDEIESKEFNLRYSCAKDMYLRYLMNGKTEMTKKWETFTYHSQNIFRKNETDWKMVYLARIGRLETNNESVTFYIHF